MKNIESLEDFKVEIDKEQGVYIDYLEFTNLSFKFNLFLRSLNNSSNTLFKNNNKIKVTF